MARLLDEDVLEVLAAGSATPDPVLTEMTEYGRERDFPIVGPNVGRLMRVVARLGNAERIFEFGSGYGYSAAWTGAVLPEDGEIHLTDFDEDNLASAREFLDRLGIGDRAHYHVGDAMDSFGETDGEFDYVLIDHEKTKYSEAFAMARDRLAPGAVVVADNMLAGPVEPAGVRGALEGESASGATAGVVEYIETVRDDDAFETALVPLGEGIAVSV
ncbi:MAG: O-methyltransferase [Halanaeroarchaeum sp.]